MLTDISLIEKAKRLVETSIGWGASDSWTNQDFNELGELILTRTRVNLSPTTLKRIWGRVKYDSAPSITTLDALVNFVGYENWRQFKLKEGNETTADQQPEAEAPVYKRIFRPTIFLRIGVLLVCVGALIWFVSYLPAKKSDPDPANFSFSSKTVITQGVPNSVIFDLDASKSPYDSVIIQQSWNSKLQAKIPKDQRQHTSIYYYPNNFIAKLIVGDKIVKEHNLLIRSDGWLSIVEQAPVPVYLPKDEAIKDGKLFVSAEQLRSRNINMEPQPPTIRLTNVRDFGEIYTDDFVFETSVKNEYKEGAAACQHLYVCLYCTGGTVIYVPLCAKGCVSDADLAFTDYYKNGKETDLSAFGVDFTNFVKLRIESRNGQAQLFVNDKLSHTIKQGITRAKIVGITFKVQGAGSVDYVKLFNDKEKYAEEF